MTSSCIRAEVFDRYGVNNRLFAIEQKVYASDVISSVVAAVRRRLSAHITSTSVSGALLCVCS